MERGEASRLAHLLRMDDHDRISQASSVATISYFPVIKEGCGKVQTFGKRCQASKRDPNCPVVIRGWLNKKDSSGLKLWKRRWFVLSNYCLFYYKDSREETVMGSIPLPSYKILFCTPRECKNRKFTFKVVHQGMRSYFFSADTQEDMLGWVRALSQSASMETDGSLNRRCSSYQDFTKIGGSSESVDLTKPTSDGEGPALKHRHISRTLSEPTHLTGGRMGTTHSEHRGRRTARHRNSRTPSPADFNRRRACGPELDDILHGRNTPPAHAEMMGQASLTPRGQLGSRPHTPVGRVDIRPHDDAVMGPQTLYYTPASPKLEYNVTPSPPVTERWQNLNKPSATYGAVHRSSSGRRPLAKSFSTGAHADLLPPLPPSSRAAHAPSPTHHHHHHHHHRSNLSVCVLPPAMSPKLNPREIPPMRPLESDADTVLTRLCGCDKLLQSLSVELAQLQMDKDGVQCALEVSRLQLEKWKNPEPRAQEEALAQKALLQEELVTIRARMCDVSLEMERVWSQYERMESELMVIRSHLQHICNFGIPQEQCQAQRELWMMEDIMAGLKINRDHFCFLLGLQRHHRFYQTASHPGSPASPTERLPTGLPMDEEQEPPVRPPLPLELHENNLDDAWTESPYEGIYSHDHRRANIQPGLPNMKAQKDKFESQPGLKWTPPETRSQSNKKIKMSEEEQMERMKRNQERLANRKKSSLSSPGAHRLSQGSETTEEPPFPLRVTRVVTAVLPSSLVARRVSVEDPPPELRNPLPERIQSELQQRPTEQSKRTYNKPRLFLEIPDQIQSSAEMHPDQTVTKANRQQSAQAVKESWPEGRRAEPTETSRTQAAVAREHAEEQPPATLTPDVDADHCLTAEQRQAKLRRVERIRERVLRSAARESVSTNHQHPTIGETKDARVASDSNRKEWPKAELESQDRSGEDSISGLTAPHLFSKRPPEMDEIDRSKKKIKNPIRFGIKTQQKDHSGRKGNIKRPDSPYHVSSMKVYQKDGGKGFTVCKNEDEPMLQEPVNDTEKDLSSCDVRAKWFLSTNHWQGFIPLPGVDSSPDIRNFSENVMDSEEMSPAVSESLEKMKDNYSLFYKIACDISISDTDITKNAENDGQASPGSEEKEQLIITEAAEETTQESNRDDKNLLKETQDKSTSGTSRSPEKEAGVPDGIPQNGNEDIVCQEGPKLRESVLRPSVRVTSSDPTLDGKAKLEGEDDKVKELKSSSSLSEEHKDKVQEREFSITRPSSACEARSEARSVTRSASLGKARVTVLRTSF